MTRGVGMHVGYRMGDHYALCDRCQKKFYASDLKKEWTGWYVCDSCWEPRHPQDFLTGKPDDPSVPWSRPDSNGNTNVTTVDGENLVSDNYYDTVSDADKTLTVGTHNPVQEWDDDLTANRFAVLDVTGAQEMDRWTVSRKGGGAFDLVIGGSVTSGTTDIYIANDLIDTTKNFNNLGVLIGDTVIQTNNGNIFTVLSIDSSQQLSLDGDMGANNQPYTILHHIKTASIPSITIVEYRNGAWALESYTPSGL